MNTPLRLARAGATPTPEELAMRASRRGNRGPIGGAGLTQGELCDRLRPLGLSATPTDICRWEKPPRQEGAVRASPAIRTVLEQALGLAPGTLSRPRCPACGGTGLSALT